MSKLPNRESPRMRVRICETEAAAPRLMRLPDPAQSESAEQMVLG
jgi:hypothetical protein